MKKLILLISALSVLSCGVGAQKKENQAGKPEKPLTDKTFLAMQTDGIYARFETDKGVIYTVLNYTKTPMTVANFVGLAEGKIKNAAKAEGVPYFDGLKFHRVEPGFVIQGGDPAGNGSGGPGYNFEDEPVTENYDKGILAMANAGPNTNGSQFFIMLADNPGLPKSYTIFGKVLAGQDVVDRISVGDVIKKVVILRKGKDAGKFDAPKVFEFEKAHFGEKAAAKAKADEEMVNKILSEKYGSAKTTASGLRYIVVKEGAGKQPTSPSSRVTVHYTGTFLSGNKFDSSLDRGQPITFGLNEVIPGWTEGLQMMKEGGKMQLIIPPFLAWGSTGRSGIPPNSWVLFDVELIKVEN